MKQEQAVADCITCSSRARNIFCNLNQTLLTELNRAKSARLYKKRQVIFYEESPALGIYCIRSGKVKLYRTNPEGKQHIFRIAKPGEVVGLESLFARGKSYATAEMLEEGTVCFLSKESIFNLIRNDPKTAEHVMEVLAEELIESEEERVDLAQSSVRERMARLLAILSQSHGVNVENGIKINLALSREEMAEMIGTAAETAMRLLKEFKEGKLVEVHGKEIIILDEKRLMQTAHLAE